MKAVTGVGPYLGASDVRRLEAVSWHNNVARFIEEHCVRPDPVLVFLVLYQFSIQESPGLRSNAIRSVISFRLPSEGNHAANQQAVEDVRNQWQREHSH